MSVSLPHAAPVRRMRRVYVAGPWARRHTAKIVAAQVRAGHWVTSRWHDLDAGLLPADDVEAAHDVKDIWAADTLLLLNLEKSEGKAVETGLALAWNLRIIVVGERSNVFHHLPHIILVDSVAAALALL